MTFGRFQNCSKKPFTTNQNSQKNEQDEKDEQDAEDARSGKNDKEAKGGKNEKGEEGGERDRCLVFGSKSQRICAAELHTEIWFIIV